MKYIKNIIYKANCSFWPGKKEKQQRFVTCLDLLQVVILLKSSINYKFESQKKPVFFHNIIFWNYCSMPEVKLSTEETPERS